MPIANSTASHIAVLPNSEPTSTINTDIPTNRAKVFSLLAWGCQVIGVLLGPRIVCGLQPIERAKRRAGLRNPLAVPADGVVDQLTQRAPPGPGGQKGPLLVYFCRILGQAIFGLG